MKKKICFIINPISGLGSKKNIEQLIDKHLNQTKFDYELVYTKAAKHALEISKQAVSNNFDIVVAVGGDGSINEIARGLIGSTTAMAIIPAGSGNGFARHMNIPMDPKKALDIINDSKEMLIDTIQFNKEVFVNIAGIGFDAHISSEFAKYGKRGFSSYIKVVMRELFNYKSQNLELIINGEPLQEKAFLISFANGSQWGNNASIAPTADISDGLLDIAILKNISFFNALPICIGLFLKKLHKLPYLKIIKAKELIVKQPNTIAHIDGEPIEIGNEIVIKVNPLSLKVIIP